MSIYDFLLRDNAWSFERAAKIISAITKDAFYRGAVVC